MGKVRAARAFNSVASMNNTRNTFVVLVSSAFVILFVLLIFALRERDGNGNSFTSRLSSQETSNKIRTFTWNIAAINNNPFEYWITNDDPTYNEMMAKVSHYISDPNEIDDLLVNEIFTDAMFQQLLSKMNTDTSWKGTVETTARWENDFRKRRSISGFLKDGVLGKKRLVSMTDRITNTIITANGMPIMRPAVINCYESEDLGSLEEWWPKWLQFMFNERIEVKKKGISSALKVWEMIPSIKKSKYPAITHEEEEISRPLQVLCAAIFDSILIHMMNRLNGSRWQPIRQDICNKLNRQKASRTAEIIEKSYKDSDFGFLQEVGSSFKDRANKRPLGLIYFDIYSPQNADSDRDQNSYILLKKGAYENVEEISDLIINKMVSKEENAPVAQGDLLAITVEQKKTGKKYLLASFHGDTNGLATIPILRAVRLYSEENFPQYKLLFGMDANTYSNPDPDQQGVVAFADYYVNSGLNSCYGKKPNPKDFTTFHARTHLQSQLNKAVSIEQKNEKGDKNPKDFILFFDKQFANLKTEKDNTGQHKYIENMVFPTMEFPSDHGITAATLLELQLDRDEIETPTNLRKIE